MAAESIPFDLVLFDNDGTLVPSHEVANPAIRSAFVRFCRERGIDRPVPSDQRICELTGMPGEAFYAALLPEELRAIAGDLRRACLQEEVREVRARARFYPGIGELLEALRGGGVRLCVASHGGEEYIGAMAQRLGYRAIFDRIFHHGLDGMTDKGAMARRAIDELAARRAVFVGDRRADLVAARDAGIEFVGCAYGYGVDGELAGSDHIVSSPEELGAILLGECRRGDAAPRGGG